MRRPPLLLLRLAFALVGVGGLLLLLPQAQAAACSCGGLSTSRAATMTRQQLPPAHHHQVRRLGGAGAEEKTRLGSRPPSCRGKCYECSPCTAVQVPTLLVVSNSNYKPVGWKCLCQDRLYQP